MRSLGKWSVPNQKKCHKPEHYYTILVLSTYGQSRRVWTAIDGPTLVNKGEERHEDLKLKG